jgi:hypothetical protein
MGAALASLEPGMARLVPVILEKQGELGVAVLITLYYLPLIIIVLYQQIKLRVWFYKNPYLWILLILFTKDMISSAIGKTGIWQNFSAMLMRNM